MLKKINFDSLLKPYGNQITHSVMLVFLQDNWANIIGTKAAGETWPNLITDRTLVILVQSTTGLAYYKSRGADMLDDINSCIGRNFVLADLRFRIGKLPDKEKIDSLIKPPKEKFYIDDELEGLERIKVLIELKRKQQVQRGR